MKSIYQTASSAVRRIGGIQNLILPILVFLISFGLYFYTAPRLSTNFADSNEMIAASYTLGIPHPPGYPLYLIIGKLFSFFPIGEIAFRYSIFCAFFGALTVALVYLTIIKILEIGETQTQKENPLSQFTSIVAALLGSLSLAFSYLFWLYSIVPEVFSLLNFFTALLIYIGVRWYEEARKKQQATPTPGALGAGTGQARDRELGQQTSLISVRGKKEINDKYLFLIALFSGLGFLSQQLIGILAPALLYLIFIVDNKILIPSKKWLWAFFGFLLGLLPLIYFPLAAQRQPLIDYGNPKTLQSLWYYLTRRIYAETTGSPSVYFRTGLTLKQALQGIPYYISYIVDQFGLEIVLVGTISILAILFSIFYKIKLGNSKKAASEGNNPRPDKFGREDKDSPDWKVILGIKHLKLEIFVLLAFLFTGPLLSIYLAIDILSFGYIVRAAQERMFIFSLVSFAILIGLGTKKILNFIETRSINVKLVAIVLLCLLIIPLKINFNTNNKRNFTLGEDFAYNLFVNMKPNAILFTRGDASTFAAFYYRYAKGERKDVTIVPFSLMSWSIERLRKNAPFLGDTESKKPILIIRDIIQHNIDKRPLYFAGTPEEQIIGLGLDANPYVLSPRGLLSQAGRDFDPKENEDFWGKMRWQGSKDIRDYYDWYSKEIFEQYVIGSYNSFVFYQWRGYYDLSKKEVERLKGIDPYHQDTKIAKTSYEAKGKYERDPIPVVLKSSQDYIKLGDDYLQRAWFVAAIGEFSMAKDLEPKNILYRTKLAETLEIVAWYNEALKEYQEILKLEPGNQEVKERIMVVKEKMSEETK